MTWTADELRAIEKLKDWKRDPVQMAVNEFGFTPDQWQADALRAFPQQNPSRLCLQAAVGVGKSSVEALLVLNFLSCYSDGIDFPNGACVSITGPNLKSNLWKEIALWRDRSPFFRAAFEMNNDRIFERQHPKTWFVEARSFDKKANPEAQGRTLAGLHSPYVAVFLDEVGDMPPAIGLVAEQIFSTGRFGKIVAAGNASSHEGLLYEIVKNQPHLWKIIRVNGDPDDPLCSTRVNKEHNRVMIDRHGRDNPWVMYAILGLFPPTSTNALLGPDEVAEAMGRHLRIDEYNFIQKRIGVDVARFGDDKTVLFPRQGRAAFNPVELRNARTEDIAGRLMAAKAKFGSELELIDDTGGYAAGVIDACRLGGVHLSPVNFAGKADDPRFYNKRAEMHWRAAEWVKSGGALPNNPELAREAVAPMFWYHSGRLQITEKDQIKAQLQGHSPDLWDAFALTFAMVDMPARMVDGVTVGDFVYGKAKSEWNPFEEPVNAERE